MSEIEVKIAEIEQRGKSNTKRIDELYERTTELEKLVNSVSVLATELTHLKEDMSEVKADLKQLVSEDGNTFKTLKSSLLWLFVGGLVSYLFFTFTGVNL